ncbi:hypothetical protein SASPL_134348 [Salvia splendens]|uniref:Ribosomal RNA-processing protein 7 C-terminal domain-containing protein n=1 Tax=Salvia splendens TaxID=180675 RepID=A0A8X8ZJZ1_SALSN|nr:hypothetical protein SASPL_134348 [Salvia splendens]
MNSNDKKKKMKKRKASIDVRVVAETVETRQVKDATPKKSGGKRKSDRKRNRSGETRRDAESIVPSVATEIVEDAVSNREPSEAKLVKQRKKKRKNVVSISHINESNGQNDESEECNGIAMLYSVCDAIYWIADSIPEEQFSVSGGINKGDAVRNGKKGKLKNTERKKKKRQLVSNHEPSDSLLETREENAEDEVYQMSSGDEDYSKGMKSMILVVACRFMKHDNSRFSVCSEWITHYHQSRPGLNVLQERIDDFIMAHEAREEQAKAEKLAQAAEGGWTVVVHQKGRKKSTEAESGIAVGSVAQAAVLDKMGKKKKKEVGLDFYQFNRREAHRNEIMMLQSKFEQDKKRIQQMRAARKFRPY